MFYLHRGHLESEESQEHEDQQNSPGQLQIHLGLVLPKTRDSCKQRLSFNSRLGQDQQQGSDKSEVSEEELKIPQDTVCDGLENHDEEEDSTSNIHFVSGQHHGHGSQLTHQIDHHEHGGEEPAAAPADVHVLSLLAPLHPHPHPVLEES